jgi:pimeloyl-ACP methyl ester carboxylesterase
MIRIPAFVLLAILTALRAATSAQALPPPGKLIDVGGYRLHLNCTGKGEPTVVLIPGGGDFSFDWSLVQPGASRFARVCSYDFAGSAWSDPGPTPRTMRQDAYELHTLLKTAGVKGPYVLVGHSLGGLITRFYAAAYQAEVAGIVLIDSTHEDTTLFMQGKPVRMREIARAVTVPPVQTIKTSPPKPATQKEIDEFQAELKKSGPPKIGPPYDRLPASSQAMRVWACHNRRRLHEAKVFLQKSLTSCT